MIAATFTRRHVFPHNQNGGKKKKAGCFTKTRHRVKELAQRIIDNIEVRHKTRVLQVIPATDPAARKATLEEIGAAINCDDNTLVRKAVDRALRDMPQVTATSLVKQASPEVAATAA